MITSSKTITAFVVLLLCLLFSLQPAMAANNPLLKDFIGLWQTNGKAFGRPAHISLHFSDTLEGKFVRINYTIANLDEIEQKVFFEGVAYYKQTGAATLSAFWADSSGDLHPITASRSENSLNVEWGIIGQKQGKTKYELISENELQVTDWILKQGEWLQFSQNSLLRVSQDPS